IELYPNPVIAGQMFSLTFNRQINSSPSVVEIVNTNGEVLKNYALKSAFEKTKIEAPKQSGMYYVLVKNNRKQILAIKRIVVI
ncbi:MAG: T9SS type A sorting domain-containing protein, partial [Bacteroidota bacterium]